MQQMKDEQRNLAWTGIRVAGIYVIIDARPDTGPFFQKNQLQPFIDNLKKYETRF